MPSGRGCALRDTVGGLSDSLGVQNDQPYSDCEPLPKPTLSPFTRVPLSVSVFHCRRVLCACSAGAVGSFSTQVFRRYATKQNNVAALLVQVLVHAVSELTPHSRRPALPSYHGEMSSRQRCARPGRPPAPTRAPGGGIARPFPRGDRRRHCIGRRRSSATPSSALRCTDTLPCATISDGTHALPSRRRS